MAASADSAPSGEVGGPGGAGQASRGVRMVVYGEELLHKRVSGNRQVGRVYLPLTWVGKRIKVILVD